MTRSVRIFGWIQLVLSLFLAASIVWSYVTFRSSVGDFMQSMSHSILSASNVITKIAETIKARQLLVDDMTKTLKATRVLVSELQTSAISQGKLLPQYSGNLKYAATLSAELATGVSNLGAGMMFSVPTKVTMEGVKPILVWTRPLAQQGVALREHAKQIRKFSDSLLSFSQTMNQDGQRLNSAFVATCAETIHLLDDAAKSIAILKRQELPDAIADLEKASLSLKDASSRVHLAEDFLLALLMVGLILSAWCFFHSVSLILLANATEKGVRTGVLSTARS